MPIENEVQEVFIDDSKKLKINVTTESNGVSLQLGRGFGNLVEYLVLREKGKKEDVPISSIVSEQKGMTASMQTEIKHIIEAAEKSKTYEIVAVSKKSSLNESSNSENPVREQVIMEFQVPGIGENDEKVTIKVDPLSTYDIKSLVHTDALPPIHHKNAHKDLELKTDLHTHFAAIPKAEDLIKMVTENGSRPFYFPADLLEIAGIKLSRYSNQQKNSDGYTIIMNPKEIAELKNNGIRGSKKGIVNSEVLSEKQNVLYFDINSLNETDKVKLINSLSITSTKQITFDDMEDYYACREPLIKNVDYLEDLLRIVAKNYHDEGVTSASLSFSARICKPEWLAIADRVLPKLEEEYGVKLRFLVGISRLLTNEQQEDIIQNFKAVADHPCIEGVDVLGSEINSTYDSYLPLNNLAKWCHENGHTDKVLRVHAGETPYHPENVGAAVMLASQWGMHVRIGHGLYGAGDDEELMEMIKADTKLKSLVIMEMCPDSNYALNHLDNTQEHALITLSKNGIPIVFGSDGPGLYYTDAKQLAKHVDRVMISNEDDFYAFKNLVQETEKNYITTNTQKYHDSKVKFEEKITPLIESEIKNIKSEKEEAASDELKAQIRQKVVEQYFKNKPELKEPKKWTPEVSKRLKENSEKIEKRLTNFLAEKKITEIKEDMNGKVIFPDDKTPIMLTGGLLENASMNDYAEVAGFIRALKTVCDPAKVCFVTTGNEHGIQKMVHQELKNSGFDVVGLISKKAKPEDLTDVLTHAVRGYNKWYDMHGFVGKQIEQNPNFKLMVFGGNMLSRHIIQTGVNVISQGNLQARNDQLYCVRGVEGASNDKARHLPQQFSIDRDHMLQDFMDKNPSLLKNISIKEAKPILEEVTPRFKNQKNWRETCHGDMGAVSSENKAEYLLFILKRSNVSLEMDEAVDFFRKNCPVNHTVFRQLLSKVDIYQTQQFNFSQLGMPTLSESQIARAKIGKTVAVINELSDQQMKKNAQVNNQQQSLSSETKRVQLSFLKKEKTESIMSNTENTKDIKVNKPKNKNV